eukprot:m.99270 g.99270  ORF g.99270 m.99270 type:complete len:187 (-) comp15326_c0_seq2:317-877(-)
MPPIRRLSSGQGDDDVLRKPGFRKGDHLRVKCHDVPLRHYWHHGIVSEVDDDGCVLSVVHFTALGTRSKREARVQETSLADFLGNEREWELVDDNGQIVGSRADVVARARSMLGAGDYSLSESNCEHFARWCQTEQAESHQVLEFGQTLFNWGALATAAVAACGVVFLTAGRVLQDAGGNGRQPRK